MNIIRLVLFVLVMGLLTLGAGGCASLHSKSVSDMAKGQGHRVSASDGGHGYFMLTLPDLDSAALLKAQCQGSITGIQTTLTSRNWFGLVQIFEETSEGWCQ